MFYIIAHGTNTINAVNWAIGEGANAVELDLDFTASGQINQFQHGPFCDCICRCPFPFTRRCLQNPTFSCYPLRQEFSLPCLAVTAAETLLPYVASRSEIALVYIDAKLEDGDDIDVAGNRVIQALEQLLFGNGYAGDVIVGAYNFDYLEYLRSAAIRGRLTSPYGQRIYFAFENGFRTPFAESVSSLQTIIPIEGFPVPPVIYGHGISSCIPVDLNQTDLQLAAINKASGAISMAYTWTVDCKLCIENDLDYVNGIITNYPSRVLEIIQKTGRRLATTADRLPGIRTTELVLDPAPYRCECDFNQSGCIIRSPAPAGLACKCERGEASSNIPECTGKFVMCFDSESPKCAMPDISLESCAQGGGDCGGYLP